MEMKNYFILIFALSFYIGSISQSEKPEASKSAVLEKIHWMIERSDMNKVRSSFQEICNENQFPALVSGLKDGVYKGATPNDDYGYRHEVVFAMKNGRLISIDYDEIHSGGHAKQRDEDYCKRMLKSGTTPAIAYPKYESEMLAKQDYNQIDAVSGASYSLYRFKLAILYAILNAGQL
jgi:major membrane immunogen (membrane-anchored lipoprotein)